MIAEVDVLVEEGHDAKDDGHHKDETSKEENSIAWWDKVIMSGEECIAMYVLTDTY